MGRQPTIDESAVLDAAEGLVRAHGVAALTLAGVAARSGISKGGLQYRFATKRDLLRAMLARAFDRLDAAVASEVAALPEGPGRLAKGYVAGMLGPRGSRHRPDAALIAAAFAEPDLLAEFAPRYARMVADLAADGANTLDATIMALATDGLWLLEVLGLKPLDDRTRADVVNRLGSLIDRAGSQT